MTLDAATLERIVRDVMQQLMTPPTAVRAAVRSAVASSNGAASAGTINPAPADGRTAPRDSASPVSTASHSAASNGVVLTENVITEAILTERAQGAKAITIGQQTVLTPTAREYLRKHNVSVTRATSTNGKVAGGASWQVLISDSATTATAALDTLRGQGITASRELLGTPQEAARKAVSMLARAEVGGVLVLTSQPALVACLANRNSRVRGTEVANVETVNTLARQLGANLLCVNPNGKSLFELRNLLRTCLTSGTPAPPAGWKE